MKIPSTKFYTIALHAAPSFLPDCILCNPRSPGLVPNRSKSKPEYQLDGSSPLATIKEADNALTGAYDAFQTGDYYSSSGGIGPFSSAARYHGR